MPCGGISPRTSTHVTPRICWVCGKPGAHHFCLEWDTWIHARCVPTFLKTDEGMIVIDHRHTAILDFDLED